jgi:hypothetical protein
MRRPRRRTVALVALAVSVVVASQQAFASSSAEPQPTNPTGFGDLLPTPDLTRGDTRTLFEQYSPMAYSLDWETGLRETFKAVFNGFAQLLMMYIVAIVRGAISVGWWLFSFTDVGPVMQATSTTIGAVSNSLVGWLLPSALALGAIVAYMQRRAHGSAMGQLVWVLAAGLLSLSFALSPSIWLNGVNGARLVGADAVMSGSSAAVGGTMQTPIAWPEPAFPGTPRDTLLRKSADASWRGFVVMPWCIAEFGSLEACKRYGKGMLDKGTDGDARMKYIENDIAKAEGGSDAETVKWTKGDSPFGRIGVLVLAAIAATLFAFLNIALAFTAMMAFIGCLLLMVVGVVFACLWILPGRARQWGLNWFEALLGLVLQSILATLIFGTALALVTAVFGLSGSLGWLPVGGLAIIVLIAAFRLRRLIEGLTTMMRPGVGSLVMGGMARQGALRLVNRLVGGLRSRAAAPEPRPAQVRRPTHGEPADARPAQQRTYRQLPAASAMATAAISGGSREASRELSGGGASVAMPTGVGRSIGVGLGGRRTTTPDGKVSSPHNGVSRALPGTPLPGSGTPVGSAPDKRRAPVVASGAKASGGPGAGRRGKAVGRPAAADLHSSHRYEPRQQVYSASLRDGPPKMSRGRRRPTSAQQRKFRDYSTVTRDGVTMLVPSRK